MEEVEHNILEAKFTERLLAAVKEVRSMTRVGVSAIVDDIAAIGGLQTAKSYLVFNSSGFWPSHERDSTYLQASKRIGRIDLSLESLALNRSWTSLFTPDELEVARIRLRRNGVDPDHIDGNRPLLTDVADLARSVEPAVLFPRRGSPSRLGHFETVEDRRRDDERVFHLWRELVRQFEQTLRLEFDDLKHLLEDPWDAQAPEEYFDDCADASDTEHLDEIPDEWCSGNVPAEVLVDTIILPICAWRALRLGVHLGKFMHRIAVSQRADSNPWIQWRLSDPSNEASAAVCSLSEHQFLIALMASFLPYMRHWPDEEDGLLWLPTNNDPSNESVPSLSPVPPLLQIEDLPFDDWEEILGKPPEELEPMHVLYVAHQAARAEVISMQASVQADSGFSRQFASVVEMQNKLDEILRNQEKQYDAVIEIRDRQEVLISETNRVVAQMESTDRHAAEQELKSTMGQVYRLLDPQARSMLFAAIQINKVPGLAAPSTIVAAVSTAFEIQLRSTVLVDLFAFLRDRGTTQIMPPKQWAKFCDIRKPVYTSSTRSEKLDLGGMELLLKHPEPAIAKFFGPDPHRKTEIAGAIAAVRPYRNEAAHQGKIDSGVARSLLDDWLGRSRPSKSIFAVLFPPQI